MQALWGEPEQAARDAVFRLFPVAQCGRDREHPPECMQELDSESCAPSGTGATCCARVIPNEARFLLVTYQGCMVSLYVLLRASKKLLMQLQVLLFSYLQYDCQKQ